MAVVYVKGLKELYKQLQTVPVRMEKNIMRSALLAGAQVVAKQVRVNAPVAEPSDRNRKRYGGYAGALRDSIKAGSTRIKGGKVRVSVRAGGGKNKKGADVYYAHWVEYGTKPHMNGRRGMHPGARPHPFMRPAADTAKGAAVVAVGNRIKQRLAKQGGLDTPDIVVEET